jgi:soluble lytic murein transglycosylase-like protein
MATMATGAEGRGVARFVLVSLLAAAALLAPRGLAESEGRFTAAGQEEAACPGVDCLDPVQERRVSRLERHLFARMTGLDPALHEDLARAILSESAAAQLDPLLVLAVIEVESGYDPSAVSAVGALGLMQLLPATLRREAAGRGGEASAREGPVANVRAGVRYLRRCLRSYPDLDVALMAYNAGPNRLHAWLQAGAVPFEVRGYARRVLAGQDRLRRSLPGVSAPLLAELGPRDG